MPKIRRQNLSPALLNLLLDRVAEREISANQLGQFADWLAIDPEVPEGEWFKRFPEMIVCGEVSLVKTFLRAGQAPSAEEFYKFVLAWQWAPRRPGRFRVTRSQWK